MIWSKQKSAVESLLSEPLRKRVKYHRTRYGPGESYVMNRGWVTLDQKEILSCSTIKSMTHMHELVGAWHSEDAQVIEQLHRQGIFTLNDYEDAVLSIIENKIEQLLVSENPLTRAFALFDRRLGKRQLKEMNFPKDENAVVIGFYQNRCEAEGITEHDY